MDPLSITASLLALIGAAKAGIIGLRKLSSYRKAPRELADLLSELETFDKILTDIKAFSDLYPNATISEGLIERVQFSASKIAAINDLVASNPFKLAKLSDENHARVVWIRYKQTFLGLREDLQVLRMDLSVRIGLIKAYETSDHLRRIDGSRSFAKQMLMTFYRTSSCRLEETLSVSIQAQKGISDQLSFIVGMMKPKQSFLDEPIDTSTAPDTASGRIAAGWPGVESDVEWVPIAKASSGLLSERTPKPSENCLAQQSNISQDSPPAAITQQCKSLCSCVCHTRSIVKSPMVLDAIIGKMNLQCIGRRPSCNEFQCRRSTESSFKVVYQLPKFITSRYISLVMRHGALSGPEFLLRVPRVVSWSHLLWQYAKNGNLLAIQKLFAEGKASPYDLNPQGSNVLHYTANSHHLRLSEFLLEQGVDIDHPNDIGIPPSDFFWGYPLGGEVGSEGTGVVEKMLTNSGNAQMQGFSTLHKIILGVVDRDLRSELETSTAGINVGDARNLTPLCWATIRNDLQAVRTLLAFHADPNVVDRWGHTPLDFARSIDTCRMLLDARVKIQASSTDHGRSALHQLFKLTCGGYLMNDNVGIIDLLVNARIDVNIRDSDGETPLLHAVFAGYTSHARRLLELGADPNDFNKSSRKSAIHLAVSFDRHDMIPLLLEYDADYTVLNANGKNIAHMAACGAGTKTISVLKESNLVNLDMCLRCKNGKTPADYLAERSILSKSEEGLHAEFEEFMRSITASDAKKANRVSKAGAVHDSVEECDNPHLPGAYPVSAEP